MHSAQKENEGKKNQNFIRKVDGSVIKMSVIIIVKIKNPAFEVFSGARRHTKCMKCFER